MMPQTININIANNIVQSFLPHMIYHKVKAIRPVTKEYIVVSTCPCRAQLLMLLYCWFNGNKKLSNSASTIRELPSTDIYQSTRKKNKFLTCWRN